MFQVAWTPWANERLQDIVQSASEDLRPRIIDAAKRAQYRLLRHGSFAGESRRGQFRILIELPLALTFWVGTDEYLDTITVVRVQSWH